jgi:hypothetical protein
LLNKEKLIQFLGFISKQGFFADFLYIEQQSM